MGYRVVRIKKGIDGSKNLQIMAERFRLLQFHVTEKVVLEKHSGLSSLEIDEEKVLAAYR